MPVVLDAIKARLNRSSRPGQFVLTGSAHHESLPRAAQALAGRLQRLPMLPLSQVEIGHSGGDLLTGLLNEPEGTIAAPASTTTRQDYVQPAVRGGLPLGLAERSTAARSRWIDDWVRLTLERDVQELSRRRRPDRRCI
ncbi:AAA family ATPase [Raineyella sp. W15-4]|uniref:AAA family ATPase n=1 Tax=Raineyella sp. W15-4 TaxID=3081651 RepID=UPI003988F2D0